MRRIHIGYMVAHKLTVVQILPDLEEGGVEGETLDLAIHLSRIGYRSIVISGGGRLVPQLEQQGCIHIYWPHVGEKSFRCLQYISKLKQFLLDEKVDILHLRSRLPAWIGYLAWKLIPELQRPSLVTTFHGFYSINSYSCIMTKGERVAAVSQTIKDHILENYKVDKDKISLIHGGFDTNEFSPEKVPQERIDKLRTDWLPGSNDKPVIVLPGRLTLWKGQDIFIDSLAKLKDINFVGLLVGDTEENSSYTKKLQERIRQHGLQDRIKLVGHCSDMPAALMLADLVVSASSTQPEAFGKVAIEAMAMAKPVVATAHGGSLETVRSGETGWLVPPLNSTALAAAIREALEQPDTSKKYGETGRKWVLEHFTADAMCKKTVGLYQELDTFKKQRKEKKKITVMQLLPELNSGGVERGTLEMGKHLVKNGHKSIVVSNGGRLVEQLEKDGSIHLQKSIGSKSPMALFHILPLRRLMKKWDIDVLHMRSRMPAWVGYLAWNLIPRRNRPVLITTFHGFYSVNAYSAIMTKGDGVIAVSKSVREHIFEKYRRKENVRQIFRGVDANYFNPDHVSKDRVDKLTQDWGIDTRKQLIMLPGRLTRLKGQEMFLKSLMLVENNDYLAVLVGDTKENPGYTNELEATIRQSGLSDKVKLVGHCSDMPAAFTLADIVLSTSSLEPEAFGRTIVEAMAMGKPVIATGHGGSLETVIPGENGWLIKPADPVELAETLDKALATNNEILQKMGENGQQRVYGNFTSQTMCEKTLNFYCELLSNRVSNGAQTQEVERATS